MANERNPCIYYLSGDGHVRQLEWNGQRFVPTDITASARAPNADLGSGLTAINTGSDRRVYYLSKNPNGHVQELAWVGKWVHTDVTGPTAAVLGSDLAVTGVGANFDPRVYHLGANGHVLESAWNGSSWTFFDVTASVHNPFMELAGSLVAAMGTGANYDPRVYYVGHDLHVWQLAWSSDEQWAADDVTKESGGQMDAGPELAEKLAAIGTGANSDPRVYNISPGLRVQQMAWIGQWVASDLTEQTEAPSAGAGVVAMGTGAYSDARVYYLDVSGHVHQLAWSNGSWSHTPLALGPAANLKSNVVAMGTGANLDPRIYYVSADGHVQQLAWTGQWSHLDVFTLTGEPLPNAILLPNALAVIGVG